MGTDGKVKNSTVIGKAQVRFVYKPLPKMKSNCKNCK